jgi:hypothetical protein
MCRDNLENGGEQHATALACKMGEELLSGPVRQCLGTSFCWRVR